MGSVISKHYGVYRGLVAPLGPAGQVGAVVRHYARCTICGLACWPRAAGQMSKRSCAHAGKVFSRPNL